MCSVPACKECEGDCGESCGETREVQSVVESSYPSRGWKPLTPWQVVARRGHGEAYVAAYYSAPDYPSAKRLALQVLNAKRPYGVPPWDSVEVREKVGMPARPKRPGAPKAEPARKRPNATCRPSEALFAPPTTGPA